MSKYAQLIEGVLIPAPTQVIKDGFIIKNPNEELLKELGYKPLVCDEVPEITTPGNRLKEVYTDQGDCIQVSYKEYTPNPEPVMPEPVMPEPVSDTEMREILGFAKMSINSVTLTDEQSLSVKHIYPQWEEFIGQSLEPGFKVLYGDKLYKVRQKISSVLENQFPSIDTAALYEEINEVASGTVDDPIPYNNNMELEEGKYYSQNGVVYLCTRSTGQAVYNNLSDLVGIYVQVIE